MSRALINADVSKLSEIEFKTIVIRMLVGLEESILQR